MPDDLLELLAQLKDEVGSNFAQLLEQFAGARKETTDLRREVLARFDGTYARFDRLANEYRALAAAVSRLESRAINRSDFERELDLLRDRIDQLEQRIGKLERDPGSR